MWFIYAFLSAGFNGGKAVCDKHLLTRENLHPYTIGFFTFLVSIIVTIPIALYLGEQTALSNRDFLYATAGNIILNIFATLLYLNLLRKNDASLINGIQAIEPLFVTIIAFLMIGETVSLYGFIGISIVIFGSIILQKSRLKEDLQSLLRHSPWILMLMYMSMTSLATVFSKMAVLEGGVFIYIAARYSVMVLVFLVLMSRLDKSKNRPYRFQLSHISSGLSLTASVIFEMLALQQAKIAYVETVRRLTVFFSLLFESWILKNKWNMKRFTACLILFMGAALIILMG